MVLEAMVDAMTYLESAAGFGTADTTQWRWGKLHPLTITPLFPNPTLNMPRHDPRTGGFPKAGDNFVVNRADMGWADLDFSQFADGPAQRFLGRGRRPAAPIARAVGAARRRDLRQPRARTTAICSTTTTCPQQHFDAPYTVDEIVAQRRERWVFH